MSLKKIMSEPEYRALPLISYSQLSGLDQGPGYLKAKPMEMTEPLIYGSAVDTLAFDGREEFERKFATIDCRKPSPKALIVIEDLIKELESNKDEDFGEEISSDLNKYDKDLLRLGRLREYGGSNWGDEAILRNLKKEGEEYFKKIIENRSKLILSSEQYEYTENSVNTLYTHPFSNDLFTAQEGEEIYFQFPIVWEFKHNGVEYKCKSLLDILKIDHNNKKIYPIDLKTTGKHVLSFPSSFIDWRYFIQNSFYSDAVKYLRDKIYPELSGYSVELFKFVVISSKNPMKPLVYQTSQQDYKGGKYGGTIAKTGEFKRGYLQLCEDMKWHIDNDKYDYPREIYESNGVVELNVFV